MEWLKTKKSHEASIICSRHRSLVLGLSLSLLASPLSAAELGPSATDQLIVKLNERANGMAAAQALSQVAGKPLRFIRNTADGRFIFRLPEPAMNRAAANIAAAMMQSSKVEYAEADLMMQPILSLADADSSGKLWGLKPFAEDANAGINIQDAWDELPTPTSAVLVAVLDTGITDHSDLNDNIVAGYDMISRSRVANDGDGRDADPSDPGDASRGQDSSWHGTHVAGTIAAVADNSKGIAGAGGQWLKVVPVRVLGKGGGYTSDITDGIRWAANPNEGGAKVINMSLGGSGSCDSISAYQSAIDYAVKEKGVTVVVAAGNSAADASGFVPASCDGVITVAAVGQSGQLAYYSNFGASVEIAAPGGDFYSDSDSESGILSTINLGKTDPEGEGYAYYQGTSMAAPHVAAVAGLLYARYSDITPASVAATLQTYANNTVPCANNGQCGAGLLDAGNALAQPRVSAYTPPDGGTGGDTGGGTGEEENGPLLITDGPIATPSKNRVAITWTTNLPSDTQVIIGSQSFGSSELVTDHKVNLRGSKGTYSYTVSSTDAAGNTVTASDSFTL